MKTKRSTRPDLRGRPAIMRFHEAAGLAKSGEWSHAFIETAEMQERREVILLVVGPQRDEVDPSKAIVSGGDGDARWIALAFRGALDGRPAAMSAGEIEPAELGRHMWMSSLRPPLPLARTMDIQISRVMGADGAEVRFGAPRLWWGPDRDMGPSDARRSKIRCMRKAVKVTAGALVATLATTVIALVAMLFGYATAARLIYAGVVIILMMALVTAAVAMIFDRTVRPSRRKTARKGVEDSSE